MRLRLSLAFACVVALVALTGCSGAKEAAAPGSVPASAAQAPADALAFVTVDTDAGSSQWTNAQALVDLFPSVKASLTQEIDRALSEKNLDWKTDVQPALGPDLVVAVTADSKPVVLLQPDDPAKS